MFDILMHNMAKTKKIDLKTIPKRKTNRLDMSLAPQAYAMYQAGEIGTEGVAKMLGSGATEEKGLRSVGCRVVAKVAGRMTDSEQVDALTAIQEKILQVIEKRLGDEEALKTEKLAGISTSYGILTDKKRLLSGDTTSNNAHIVVQFNSDDK